MRLLDVIGNTPIVEVGNYGPSVKVFGKLEGQNPGGSVKDRAALGMIGEAMKRGDIKEGDKLVEATSGNTGIALAMIANLYGLKMTLVMPDNSTIERVKTMKAYGAVVILTPAKKTIEYSRELAEQMEGEGYKMLNQFANPDNCGMHYKTTGPEIYRDTEGRVTHFVSAMGTTGTIMGVSKYLKQENSEIQIVGTQPSDGASIPGIRRWTPEFLPKIYDESRVDRKVDVSEENAKLFTQKLSKEEGIFAGMSAGGAYYAADKIAKEISEGCIVFIVCDRGDRYTSSDLFG